MNVKEIIKEYLKREKLGGLINIDGWCLCYLNDLIPDDDACSECILDCLAATENELNEMKE